MVKLGKKKKKYITKYAGYIAGRSYVSRPFTRTVTPVSDGRVLLLQSGYLLLQNNTKLSIQ